MGAQRLRFYIVPGANVETALAYEVRVFNPPIPAAGGPCVDQVLPAGRVALVDSISVNNKALTGDGQKVSADRDLDVTWSTTDGDADVYTASLIEMTKVPVGGGDINTVPVVRASVTSTTNRAVIRRKHLEPGRYYYVAVQTHIGFPGAQAGDFATIDYPRGASNGVSGVFLVE